MIIRIKTLLLLLGGEMEKYGSYKPGDNNEAEDEDDDDDLNNGKKKGRPKKAMKPLFNISEKSASHINTIRVQLEPLRLLSDMIKKREKTKYKVLESEQEIFL